jgi:hypothetical protein
MRGNDLYTINANPYKALLAKGFIKALFDFKHSEVIKLITYLEL